MRPLPRSTSIAHDPAHSCASLQLLQDRNNDRTRTSALMHHSSFLQDTNNDRTRSGTLMHHSSFLQDTNNDRTRSGALMHRSSLLQNTNTIAHDQAHSCAIVCSWAHSCTIFHSCRIQTRSHTIRRTHAPLFVPAKIQTMIAHDQAHTCASEPPMALFCFCVLSAIEWYEHNPCDS